MDQSLLKFYLVLITTFCGISFSQASSIDPADSRFQQLRSLYMDNLERFDSEGNFLPNSQKNLPFLEEQEEFVARMKQLGALNEVLLIENDFNKTLWVRLYTFQAESGELIAFFYEKAKYSSAVEQSYLRFVSLSAIETGLNLAPVKGSYALRVQGYYFKPETGGTLQFHYPKDFKRNQWESLWLYCLYKEGTWGIQTLSYQGISHAFVSTWTRILPPNGGVRSISTH